MQSQMDYYGNNDFRDYHLSHHGILGMKWGVRRFQPYSVNPRKSGESGKEMGLAKRFSKKKAKDLVNAKQKQRQERKEIKLKEKEIAKSYEKQMRSEIVDAYKDALDYADREGLSRDDDYVHEAERETYIRNAQAYGVDRRTIDAVLTYSRMTDIANIKEEEIVKKYNQYVNDDLMKKYGDETLKKFRKRPKSQEKKPRSIDDEMIKEASKKAGGSLSKVTMRVIKDYNHMDDKTFMRKYSVSKGKYFKRVSKYGDPYVRSAKRANK